MTLQTLQKRHNYVLSQHASEIFLRIGKCFGNLLARNCKKKKVRNKEMLHFLRGPVGTNL